MHSVCESENTNYIINKAVFATTLILKVSHFMQDLTLRMHVYFNSERGVMKEKSLTTANTGITPSSPQLEVKL